MTCLLPTDCLNDVFENLENDYISLHSCLLVSRLWCKVSVRILWRNIWSFKYSVIHVVPYNRLKVASSILSTLISCLPNESKELLQKNEIFISTPTSKPPLFNYVSFCKVLSINEIYQIINKVLKNDKSITALSLLDRNCLVSKEMLKMFMSQVSSLKSLTCYSYYMFTNNTPFISFPGAKDCLADLSELYCSSDIHYQLSRICHNLQSLTIHFKYGVSDELKELVSSQVNLKFLALSAYDGNDWVDIIPSLARHSNTLTKLYLCADGYVDLPLSFVSSFLNLQELKLSFEGLLFEGFKALQYVTFPKLQTLKFPNYSLKHEYLTKFLETNGKSLQELYIHCKASDLSIDKYCPNLKKLYVIFKKNELDMLKIIFNSCQYLEGIVIECGIDCLNDKEVFETVAKYSPKNFYELKLHNPELFPENLESFFISWKNRTSKKSLNLIIVDLKIIMKEENMKIIEKYKNLGIIKKFEVKTYFGDKEEIYL